MGVPCVRLPRARVEICAILSVDVLFPPLTLHVIARVGAPESQVEDEIGSGARLEIIDPTLGWKSPDSHDERPGWQKNQRWIELALPSRSQEITSSGWSTVEGSRLRGGGTLRCRWQTGTGHLGDTWDKVWPPEESGSRPS